MSVRRRSMYPEATDQEAGFSHDILQITASFKGCPTLNQILDLVYLRIS